MLSGLLWSASFPPLNLWPLAWIAPVGLVALIRRKTLSGKRPYLAIWLAGFVHWFLILHFLRLPHWTGYLGWVGISIYLAFYFPIFVALARVAVHQFRVSVIVVAPVVWVGLELVRGHLFSGFSVALLGHTQVSWIWLIQIADLFGAYGVSFVVMLIAACLARLLPGERRSLQWWPALPMFGLLAAVLAYGDWRVSAAPTGAADKRELKVALIQGNYETIFDTNQESNIKRSQKSFTDYRERSLEVSNERPDLDLIIWPESMFANFEYLDGYPDEPIFLCDFVFGDDVVPDPELELEIEEYRSRLGYFSYLFEKHTRLISAQLNRHAEAPEKSRLNIAMLVGCETRYFEASDQHRYNSALLIDSDGEVIDRYYKMHRVLFGEYVPFGELFPWLYQLTPMGQGLAKGVQPRAFQVNGMNLSPSVCFESTVPHLVRRQVAELRRQGSPVDVLVNITNDGWFKGSSALDLHLTCNVFRAVENRLPMLVAANTGLSAWIDGDGRIRKSGQRQQSGYFVAETHVDGRFSLYQRIGDWPAGLCALLSALLGFVGLISRWRLRRLKR